MHLIALVVQIAMFLHLASANTPSVWVSPLDENKEAYYEESFFKQTTGFTSYTLALDLRGKLDQCMSAQHLNSGKLVLVPVLLDVTPDGTVVNEEDQLNFQHAVVKAIPDDMYVLDLMATSCELSCKKSIPDSTLKVLKDKAVQHALDTKSKWTPQDVETFIANNVEWQWNQCLGMAWGMLAKPGSIAIEPEMTSTERDYIGQLVGLKQTVTIPVNFMKKTQFTVDKPVYELIKGRSIKGQWDGL